MKKILNKFLQYYTFIKYLFVAGISFAIDIILFHLFKLLTFSHLKNTSIIVSAIIARIISSFLNYLMNRNKVFEKGNNTTYDKTTLIEYYILVAISLTLSTSLIFIIHNYVNIDPTLIKIPVDIIIFIINYIVQKKYIFKERV